MSEPNQADGRGAGSGDAGQGDADANPSAATGHGTGRPGAGRTLRNFVGIGLLAFGIGGLILPILSGLLLMAVGVALLDLPIKHRLHARMLRYDWYAWLAARGRTARDRVRSWLDG